MSTHQTRRPRSTTPEAANTSTSDITVHDSSAPSNRLALSPREFAAALGLSHPVIYRLIRKGMPVIHPTPAVTRIIPGEAIEWMRAQGGQ